MSTYETYQSRSLDQLACCRCPHHKSHRNVREEVPPDCWCLFGAIDDRLPCEVPLLTDLLLGCNGGQRSSVSCERDITDPVESFRGSVGRQVVSGCTSPMTASIDSRIELGSIEHHRPHARAKETRCVVYRVPASEETAMATFVCLAALNAFRRSNKLSYSRATIFSRWFWSCKWSRSSQALPRETRDIVLHMLNARCMRIAVDQRSTERTTSTELTRSRDVNRKWARVCKHAFRTRSRCKANSAASARSA
mmetsp:Transcript_13177/g.40052  ORF Transcript_13177/g.40052 Transcript_13177/m.40052 type:complete len:251 (-) Transcript_13177:132-884(-)